MNGERAAIAPLVARFDLPPSALEPLACLVRLLRDDPAAPTTIRGLIAIVEDHLADSLVALEVPEVRLATMVVDIGSGAGLPGLPLAIALPQARVTLLESAGRKAAFLERASAGCGVSNVDVAVARAEAWPEGRGRFDLVTARALAALAVVAEYAAPLLRIGGTLVAWRGRRDAEAEAQAVRAASELGLAVREPIAVRPYDGAEHRHLHLFTKVAETPARFPRRPGVARKRPLGAGQGV